MVSGVPQGLVLGPALLNTTVGDTDSGTEHTLSKAADSTKLCAVIDMLQGRKAEKKLIGKKPLCIFRNKDK